MALAYAQDYVNYDHLVGVKVRGKNKILLGTIVRIEYAVDRWRHHNAIAVLDNGQRIACRRFDRSK